MSSPCPSPSLSSRSLHLAAGCGPDSAGRTSPRRQEWDFPGMGRRGNARLNPRSEEHTSELQSRLHLVCRLLLEKKKKKRTRLSAQRTVDTLRTCPVTPPPPPVPPS